METRTPVITGRVTRRWFAAGGAALLAWATLAAADDFPAFRQGLWEFQRTLYMAHAQGEPPTQTIRTCTSPTIDMKKKWDLLAAQSCKFSPITRDGSRYTYRSVCKRDDRELQVASTITFETDSAYRINTESVSAGGPSREVVVAHRVGECPGDRAGE